MHRPGGETAVLSAKAKDFRGGRNGERGEIASSLPGGRASMSTRHSVANNENCFSLIVATTVASVQPKNEKRQINVAMEVLLSAMLVRRTERADDSTKAVGA